MNEKILSPLVEISNPAGLHARPAAVLASKAKTFSSDIRLIAGSHAINAKSVVAIMGLSTQHGDKVQIEALGEDAEQAAQDLAELIRQRCGEHDEDVPVAIKPQSPLPVQQETENLLTGVAASPGIAIGKIFHYRVQDYEIEEKAENPKVERKRFEDALKEADTQIEAIQATLSDPAKKAILATQQELLQDPDLLALTYAGLAERKTAAWAWRAAYSAFSARLESQQNPLLQERANDIRDIGRRVLAILAGVSRQVINVPAGAVLIAEDLTPSDTVALDPQKVAGFCTRTGGATSHVAILARSLGIPAICGISQRALTLPEETCVILDGTNGTLTINPDTEALHKAENERRQTAAREEEDRKTAHQPAVTLDGTRIEVVANIRNQQDAREAITGGAEGVGLLRTEFLFADRDTSPDEQEQMHEYRAIADIMGQDRPLVIRTLDVGGDKPLSYLPLPAEDNPFLGLRGIRISMVRHDLLRTQIRAILGAASRGRLHIMFPMISSLEELRAAKAVIAEEQAHFPAVDIKTGIMVETPAAAILAGQFAAEVDFFSIGTNDLTQYVLAMDRGHPELARFADALHPAVCAAIASTCEGANQHGIWVGVCGGLASEPLAVPLLIGLGVRELSVTTPAIAAIKATVTRWSLHDCEALARHVKTLATTEDIRTFLRKEQR